MSRYSDEYRHLHLLSLMFGCLSYSYLYPHSCVMYVQFRNGFSMDGDFFITQLNVNATVHRPPLIYFCGGLFCLVDCFLRLKRPVQGRKGRVRGNTKCGQNPCRTEPIKQAFTYSTLSFKPFLHQFHELSGIRRNYSNQKNHRKVVFLARMKLSYYCFSNSSAYLLLRGITIRQFRCCKLVIVAS